jgi:uncharacterized protein YlxW (UPF0749 family)
MLNSNSKRWLGSIVAVAVVTGFLVTTQFRSTSDARRYMPSRRTEDLLLLLQSLEKEHQLLNQALTQVDVNAQEQFPSVKGPGLKIIISETSTQNTETMTETLDISGNAGIQAEDLLKIINELNNGGAEAIAINQHRLTTTSEIITAGGHILVNSRPLHPPYWIEAIGPSQEMLNALNAKGGVNELLKFLGVSIKPTVVKQLTLPKGIVERA